MGIFAKIAAGEIPSYKCAENDEFYAFLDINPLVKGDKVFVFHKKRKKGHRKFNGHRQQFTELSIKQVVA